MEEVVVVRRLLRIYANKLKALAQSRVALRRRAETTLITGWLAIPCVYLSLEFVLGFVGVFGRLAENHYHNVIDVVYISRSFMYQTSGGLLVLIVVVVCYLFLWYRARERVIARQLKRLLV